MANAHQLETYGYLRGHGETVASRGGLTEDEILFISKHHYRGTSPSGIAKMLNRPIPSIEAITSRLDRRSVAPLTAPPDMPYVSPSIRLKLVRPKAAGSMASVAQQLGEEYGVSLVELCGPSRCAWVAKPRQAAFHALYAMRREDGGRRWSLPQIGRFFGGRDHTTILHGVRQHEKRLAAQRLGAA